MFLDARLDIGVSIDIFFGFSFFYVFYVFLFIVFFENIVTGLNVSEFNQMYEILG